MFSNVVLDSLHAKTRDGPDLGIFKQNFTLLRRLDLRLNNHNTFEMLMKELSCTHSL